jgi:hypothetical protein
MICPCNRKKNTPDTFQSEALNIPCCWGITMPAQEKAVSEGLQKLTISVLISHTTE